MSTARHEIRIPPREPLVGIVDCTILVRVPEQPEATRVFTEAEAGEAQRYCGDVGGIFENLPLTGGGDS
jgi:hypothetical protein